MEVDAGAFERRRHVSGRDPETAGRPSIEAPAWVAAAADSSRSKTAFPGLGRGPDLTAHDGAPSWWPPSSWSAPGTRTARRRGGPSPRSVRATSSRAWGLVVVDVVTSRHGPTCFAGLMDPARRQRGDRGCVGEAGMHYAAYRPHRIRGREDQDRRLGMKPMAVGRVLPDGSAGPRTTADSSHWTWKHPTAPLRRRPEPRSRSEDLPAFDRRN